MVKIKNNCCFKIIIFRTAWHCLNARLLQYYIRKIYTSINKINTLKRVKKI